MKFKRHYSEAVVQVTALIDEWLRGPRRDLPGLGARIVAALGVDQLIRDRDEALERLAEWRTEAIEQEAEADRLRNQLK